MIERAVSQPTPYHHILLLHVHIQCIPVLNILHLALDMLPCQASLPLATRKYNLTFVLHISQAYWALLFRNPCFQFVDEEIAQSLRS